MSTPRGALQFEAAIARGLTDYVGREHELEQLQRALSEARTALRVVDVVGEPGMGKSRLLHEFRQRLAKGGVFVLSGSCAPDGQGTPFFPFIEIVRSSFQLAPGEPQADVRRKLELGLTALGALSEQNLGLLQNLLGLGAPEHSLWGLDGVLIGSRTRDLLKQLLEIRCGLTPVAMFIEDLHWSDSASQELFATIFGGDLGKRLLVVHTRRPEYLPPWRDRSSTTSLELRPLAAGEIERLVKARIRTESLPEDLARLVVEKAEGNALFAEEVVAFLSERGAIRVEASGVEFDSGTVSAALPASVESLLAARVDRLSPQDRTLLQVASAIGRRFDSELLRAAAGRREDLADRLAACEALGLVLPNERTGDYAFKHALVRDALYNSLLKEERARLHLKIAEAIEMRGGNRLWEVAEALAHHYRQTDRADKAFSYLATAGAKSMRVYSLGEAEAYFVAAIALLEDNAACASDAALADLLADYTLLLNTVLKFNEAIRIVERHTARLDRIGDSRQSLLIRTQRVSALLWTTRFREAAAAQKMVRAMADRLGDAKTRAYALASEIHTSTMIAPKTLSDFEAVSREAIAAASSTDDVYIQCWTQFVVGWEEIHRGRTLHARAAASELMAVGRSLNDPRSTAMGLALLTWIALGTDDHAEALRCSEEAIKLALTPFDSLGTLNGKGVALVLLGRVDEGEAILREFRTRCAENGWLLHLSGSEPGWAVLMILHGRIWQGIRWLESKIALREQEGHRTGADWYRLILCDVYLEIIGGKKKPPFATMLANLPTLLYVFVTASSKITGLINHVRKNPHLDPAGHHVARTEMLLGLLYKIKRKRALAFRHLAEARRLAAAFGPSPMLARIDAALIELQ
jgi:hypothetical protein